MDEHRAHWHERHEAEEGPGTPSRFVLDALDLLGPPRSTPLARALDVACGRGRHALLLAERGYRVEAVDFALPALTPLRRHAAARGLEIGCVAADLATWPFPIGRYALVLVVSFLDRALFAALRAAVTPGGVLLYETHVRAPAAPPAVRPEFALEPGELDALCRDWHVLLRRDDEAFHRGRLTIRSGILARRPPSPH